MDIPLLLQGLLLGFSIAAPVGPIGVLCIRRTLTDGRAAGLVSGLGAASADAVYGCVAAFGLTFISDFLVGQKYWLGLLVGLFLCYIGIKTMVSKPAGHAASAEGRGLIGAYASTFALTLSNPMTIISFTAIFVGLGLATTGRDYLSAALLVLGVFLGSALWWFLLSLGVGLFRERFGAGAMLWVNRISGVIITVFGVLALLNTLMSGGITK